MKLYWVYILASRSKVLYVGVTGDLRRRMAWHRDRKGSRFAARYRVNRLVWYEPHSSPTSAIAREKQIKGWLRAKKLALVESMNPGWRDLSEEDEPTQVLIKRRNE